MEVTEQKVFEDYKKQISGRGYIYIFIIMTAVFVGIGALAGSPLLGLFPSAAMGIYMLISTASARRFLKKLKKGEFEVYLDVVVKKHYSRTFKGTSRWYIYSEKLFPSGKDMPTFFDSVEENHPFAAVYVGRKPIILYDLTTHTLSPEVQSKVNENLY